MELARAIASPQNPLTARVFANRMWQWRFGRGIVATPSNFGQLGERPSHPGLLDWLAAEFVDGGWSVKALDRAVLLSEAYRRSSSLIAKNYEADPGNRLFWRFSPVERLDAETLRDSLLAVSDGLDLALGGPPDDIGGDTRVGRSTQQWTAPIPTPGWLCSTSRTRRPTLLSATRRWPPAAPLLPEQSPSSSSARHRWRHGSRTMPGQASTGAFGGPTSCCSVDRPSPPSWRLRSPI